MPQLADMPQSDMQQFDMSAGGGGPSWPLNSEDDTSWQLDSGADNSMPSMGDDMSNLPGLSSLNKPMSSGGSMDKDTMIASIKAYQRNGAAESEAWVAFCDANCRGLRDPSRHDPFLLQQFMESHGVPEAAPDFGKGGGGGGCGGGCAKGKGGGGFNGPCKGGFNGPISGACGAFGKGKPSSMKGPGGKGGCFGPGMDQGMEDDGGKGCGAKPLTPFELKMRELGKGNFGPAGGCPWAPGSGNMKGGGMS